MQSLMSSVLGHDHITGKRDAFPRVNPDIPFCEDRRDLFAAQRRVFEEFCQALVLDMTKKHMQRKLLTRMRIIAA